MIKYALDTNIVTYFLKGNKTISDRIITETDNKNIIIIPPTVFFEVKRWLLAINSNKKLKLFESLCLITGIDSIDKEILEIASEIFFILRNNGNTIGDNDLLIAAYCINRDLILVTNNEKHFRVIENLKTVNWL